MEKVSGLKWDVFDKNDPVQHQMKVMGQFGSYFGFRGNGEHTQLRVENIEKGVFPDGHHWERKEFFGIIAMPDKTTKLTSANPTLHSNSHARIPVESKPG